MGSASEEAFFNEHVIYLKFPIPVTAFVRSGSTAAKAPNFCCLSINLAGSNTGGGVMSTVALHPTLRTCCIIARVFRTKSSRGTCCFSLHKGTREGLKGCGAAVVMSGRKELLRQGWYQGSEKFIRCMQNDLMCRLDISAIIILTSCTGNCVLKNEFTHS